MLFLPYICLKSIRDRKPVFWTLRNYITNFRIWNDFQIPFYYMTGCRINKSLQSHDSGVFVWMSRSETSLLKLNTVFLMGLWKIKLEIQRDNKKQMVVFSARVSTSNQDIQPGQTIIFSSVETNIADGYNPTTGEFCAPLPGVYTIKIKNWTWLDWSICEPCSYYNSI